MNIIKDVPWYDRPGNKLIREGVKSLSNADLLSIILGKVKNGTVLDASNKILTKYNLNKIGSLSINELIQEFNGDRVSALKVLSFIELSKRYSKLIKGGYNKKVINSAKDIYNMFIDEFRDYKKEVLSAVLLDTKNKVISVKEISVGTLNSSLIHPREVFKEAIKESAYSIILVHNHPSGDPTPSDEDLSFSEKLRKIGDEIGIKVLDHVIIGRNNFWNWLDSQS